MNGEIRQLSILSDNRTVSPARVEVRSRSFYLGMTVFMFAVVAAGFWAPYFEPLLRGIASRPWLIHLHAAVFVGWMALLFLEVLFVVMGRIQLHRTVGNIGMAYGALVFVSGVLVALTVPAQHVRSGAWS